MTKMVEGRGSEYPFKIIEDPPNTYRGFRFSKEEYMAILTTNYSLGKAQNTSVNPITGEIE